MTEYWIVCFATHSRQTRWIWNMQCTYKVISNIVVVYCYVLKQTIWFQLSSTRIWTRNHPLRMRKSWRSNPLSYGAASHPKTMPTHLTLLPMLLETNQKNYKKNSSDLLFIAKWQIWKFTFALLHGMNNLSTVILSPLRAHVQTCVAASLTECFFFFFFHSPTPGD